MNATKSEIEVCLTCEQSHTPWFCIYENDGTADQPRGKAGEWMDGSGEVVERVPLDSYVYSHGGCCYRSAQDTLHGLDVYHA